MRTRRLRAIPGKLRERLTGALIRSDVLREREVDLAGRRLVVRREGLRPFDRSADHDDGWLTALIGASTSYLDIGCSVGMFAMVAALDPERRVVVVDANTRALTTCAATWSPMACRREPPSSPGT